MKNYYFDMDGVLSNFHKEQYSYVNASNRQWIAHLDPFIENISLVKSLIQQGHTVYILSKAASEQAKIGKFEWLEKYLPEIPTNNIIIIVGSGRKVDYIKTDDGILIDDDIKNIRQWKKGGYKAVYVEVKGGTIDIENLI